MTADAQRIEPAGPQATGVQLLASEKFQLALVTCTAGWHPDNFGLAGCRCIMWQTARRSRWSGCLHWRALCLELYAWWLVWMMRSLPLLPSARPAAPTAGVSSQLPPVGCEGAQCTTASAHFRTRVVAAVSPVLAPHFVALYQPKLSSMTPDCRGTGETDTHMMGSELT